jgi:uncharacterized membrane protein
VATSQRRRDRIGWTVPSLYIVGALAFGLLLPRLEHYQWPTLTSTMSTGAAMTICAAIASGMIALTAIVFSLAFLMVQFSATAYSPRLVLWIARDPVLSHSLGTFSATFLYALMMIAWVDREASGRVPLLSTWCVFGLLVASMALFIALIERIGRLQVNQMLIFTADQGRQAIEALYPAADTPGPIGLLPEGRGGDATHVIKHQSHPQVIQSVDVDALVRLAAASDATIEMLAAVGDTVVLKTPVVRIWGGRPIDEAAIADRVEMGAERTFEQDPKFALRVIVDIAIRALSPAINDPTTAVQALDQIEDLLIRIGCRRLDVGHYCDSAGRVRLILPMPSWDDFLRLSIDEIRTYGATSVQVMRRMHALTESLAEVVAADRLPALRRWERRVEASIEQAFATVEERRDASVGDRQGLGITEKEDQDRS